MSRAFDGSCWSHVATDQSEVFWLIAMRNGEYKELIMVALRHWWMLAVLSAGVFTTTWGVAAEGPFPVARKSAIGTTTAQLHSRPSRGNPFATVADTGAATGAVQRREAQRRLPSEGLDDAAVEDSQAPEDRLSPSGQSGEQTAASGEKTAFFGCGWGFGCAPCRPVCRPACPPVGYGCPSPYPAYGAPCGYGAGYGVGYGGGCAPAGGCYPVAPPAPAGGFYSGPVIPPAISSPVIGTPAGYYGGAGGYYPGYGASGYGGPGYGAPAYGYPVYGDSRSSNDSDRELSGKTRAVSRLLQDSTRNPFAD